MRINLDLTWFTAADHTLAKEDGTSVVLSRYATGVEALTVSTPRGRVQVLPFLGQMIWDCSFDGVDLTMANMFAAPRRAQVIVDTYGCFAFHSGLLANGCPSPRDTHPLHGEMPCAPMDEAWVEITDTEVVVGGSVEYVQGFGHHYRAEPRVRISRVLPQLRIEMAVTNLSKAAPMPLQYMCHLNPTYPQGARITSNLPDGAIVVRESIPEHVHPTPQWVAYLETLKADAGALDALDAPHLHDPEIVRFADAVDRYGDTIEVEMAVPAGPTLFVEFPSAQFPVMSQWFLYNADQRVAAFALPGTCRPEGHLAAQASGTLIHLAPGERREFGVLTGLRA